MFPVRVDVFSSFPSSALLLFTCHLYFPVVFNKQVTFLRVSFSFVESGSDSKTRDNMDTYRAPQPFVLG